MVLAVPAGRLADRFGRGKVLLGGYALLLATYVTVLSPLGGWVLLALALLLLGSYYAATDGVLMALGSPVIPEEMRGSGLALLGTVTSLSRLVGVDRLRRPVDDVERQRRVPRLRHRAGGAMAVAALLLSRAGAAASWRRDRRARRRVAVFAGLVLICLVGVGVVVAGSVATPARPGVGQRGHRAARRQGRRARRSCSSGPRVQGRRRADGQLELAPVSAPSAKPTELALKCDRSYFSAGGEGSACAAARASPPATRRRSSGPT